MKVTRLVFCLAVVFCLSFVVVAQEGAQKSADKGKTVTVTGCLAQGTEADTYTLTDTSSKNKDKMTYKLTAASGVDLKAHVGHKVTLTGKAEGGSELARTEPGAAAGSMTHKLEVTNVKHVSPTCP